MALLRKNLKEIGVAMRRVQSDLSSHVAILRRVHTSHARDEKRENSRRSTLIFVGFAEGPFYTHLHGTQLICDIAKDEVVIVHDGGDNKVR